ncbi:MAG: L,D-transpeptidase family protein [Hyphomicrobium sp.]
MLSLLGSFAPAGARDTLIKPEMQSRWPLLVVVSLRKQKLRVFDIGGEIASSRVSSGMPGFDTPTGVFSVLEKKVHHFSNIYSGAPMPFMQRITWSGIALHSGVVPGYRASHGCIRLPHSFARSLYGLTKAGVRVVVTQDETQPVPFSHPKLFQPLPERAPTGAASAGAPDTRLAANDVGASSESMSEFRTMLGITPALAAAAADWRDDADRPLTRADADRRVAERIAEADSNLKRAQSARLAGFESSKVAAQSAATIGVRLAAARREAEPGRRALRAAEAALAKANRNFEEFLRAPMALGSADAEDREADLEESILDASVAISEAYAGLARGEIELAALEAEARAAERARSVAVAAVKQAETDLKSAQIQLTDATKDAARRSKPLSVLISVKSGRIYLRQGFEAVLESPIGIDGPPRKIGTYVLTAMRYDPRNSDTFDWRLVTAQPPAFANREPDRRNKRKSSEQNLLPAYGSSAEVLAAALEGITIPPEIHAQIAERARAGASLIITDRELKENENGLNTEFVLHTR